MPATVTSCPASQGALAVWMEFWRTLWLDLPLAWLEHVDRMSAVIGLGEITPMPMQAVTLGIGCEPSFGEAMDGYVNGAEQPLARCGCPWTT